MTKTRFLPPVDWLQERADEILSERDEALVEERLREVLLSYDPLNYTINYGAPLWRGRKCNTSSGFDSLSDVHYPPAECVTPGRVNDSGSPVLYVSFTQFTALAEIGAEPGDIIQVVGYNTLRGYPIRSLTLGEFANVHLRGKGHLPSTVSENINRLLLKMDFEPGMSFVFLDSFLAAVMASQNMASDNYMHSRILARLLFEKYPGISAIHYQSVARTGAMNLAVKPRAADDALTAVGTSVLYIEKTFDYGLCRFSTLKHSTRFEENKRIRWNEFS